MTSRYLRYNKVQDNYILTLIIDEYREVQQALNLLQKQRSNAKAYYHKNHANKTTRQPSKISVLLEDVLENRYAINYNFIEPNLSLNSKLHSDHSW